MTHNLIAHCNAPLFLTFRAAMRRLRNGWTTTNICLEPLRCVCWSYRYKHYDYTHPGIVLPLMLSHPVWCTPILMSFPLFCSCSGWLSPWPYTSRFTGRERSMMLRGSPVLHDKNHFEHLMYYFKAPFHAITNYYHWKWS